MRVVTILALMPIDITGFQVKPTMPSVLYIMPGFIIGLRCFCLLIHIRIIAILALISVDSTSSPVIPPEFSRGPSLPAGSGDGIAFVTLIFEICTAPCHPESQ
jgi:hypothetical protein